MNAVQPQRMSGFSLVEIMAGMVIGLIGILVVMQVFATFEGQKRTTTSGADAQTNGTLALYTIEREARMAGYGLSLNQSKCGNFYSYYDNGSGSPSTAPGFNTTPITITEGSGGTPDSLNIRYVTSDYGIIATQPRSNMANAGEPLSVNSVYSCKPDGFVLASDGTNCTLMKITALNSTGLTITHDSGTGSADNPQFNPPASYLTSNSWPKYTTVAEIACFNGFSGHTYSVSNNALQQQDPITGASLPLIDNIVSMQAQYGVAPAGSNQVNEWVDATGIWAAGTISVANLARIRAVHIAIVARSGLIEKTDITGTCTTAKGTTSNGPCAWDDTNFPSQAPAINLSADANWKRYRYRVYETIIPLRNVIWQNTQS